MPTKLALQKRLERLRIDFHTRLLTDNEIMALVKADKPPPPEPKPEPEQIPVTHRGELTRQEYAEFLQGYNWDYFLTSTFRRPRKEPYYALQSVWHQLQRYFVARAFLVCEPHQSGDLHIHGLAAGNGAGWRPELALPWDIWAGLFNRFGRAKVEACNTQEAVTGYCAKYLLKQQSRVCDYYEVFGNKFAWHNGQDLTSS